MASDLVLAAFAALVGLLIGAVGIGGVLLISFLVLFGGLGIHQAAATALFSFLFAGLLGTWLYQKRGSIRWRITLPVCLAALVCGFLGAMLASRLDPQLLASLIAVVIVLAGIYVLLPSRKSARQRDGTMLELAAVGAVSGFGSGFSGAGGPVFSVPIMVILGYVPLTAVATSQALQVIAAVSGSLENYRHGFIDFRVAWVVTLSELLGVLAGVRLAHAASALALRRLAGLLCIASGGLLFARTLW